MAVLEKELLFAVIRGEKSLVEKLIENGADINTQEEASGYTPLMYAVDLLRYEIVDVLLSHNPEIQLLNENNKTVMAIANQCNDNGMMRKKISDYKIKKANSLTYA